MKYFYIGWHQLNSGPSGPQKFPLTMVSYNRLRHRKTPFKVNGWALDSGAYTLLKNQDHIAVKEYADFILDWKAKQPGLIFYVCQDYPVSCGLSVKECQLKTTANYWELFHILYPRISLTPLPLIPVIHGGTVLDYLAHMRLYDFGRGTSQLIGVGSLVKRPTQFVEALLFSLRCNYPNARFHGFGLKASHFTPLIWDLLYSSDSQAASYAARKAGENPNNPQFALYYYNRLRPPEQGTIFKTKDHVYLGFPDSYSLEKGYYHVHNRTH